MRERMPRGRDRRGDELPEWGADTQARPEKIRQAKATLEADAQASAEATRMPSTSHEAPHAWPTPPASPPPRNCTDSERRIMKTEEGLVPEDNAQAAVDAASQIIVAQHVPPCAPNNQQQLVSLLAQIQANPGRQARAVSADAGYCSEANLQELRWRPEAPARRRSARLTAVTS